MDRSTDRGAASSRLHGRLLISAIWILGVSALSRLATWEPATSIVPGLLRRSIIAMGWMLAPLGLLVGSLVAGLRDAARAWPRDRDPADGVIPRLISIQTDLSRRTLACVAGELILAGVAGLGRLGGAALHPASYVCGGAAVATAATGVLAILAAEVRIVETGRDEGEERDGTGATGVAP